MRMGLAVGCILLLWDVSASAAREPAQTNRKAEPGGSPAPSVLREASDIVLKQDEHQRYWCERVLLYIGDVQIRAGDFNGALKSIHGSSYEYGRNQGLVELAEALARDGNRERAFDVLRLAGSDHGWRQDYLDDGVQLRWIEHLIASGDLDRARKAIEQLKAERSRPEGLRTLAVAYAKSGDEARAAAHFACAVEAAAKVKDEYDRASAFWETADAQLTVGAVDAAKATIGVLVETVELKNPWVKVSALRESAVLAARAKDDATARRLFHRAIGGQPTVDALNKIGALEAIAVDQAVAGHIDDARKTASMIKHSEQEFTQDGARERGLFAIAMAQLKANDVDGAVRTALTVEYYVQYRDDALREIVDHLIAKRDLTSALTNAGKTDNPSRKATAILKVATAHAKAGDRKTAADVAARIELTQKDPLFAREGKERFDHRLPRTWGVYYDVGSAFTTSSLHASHRRAAEVAAAAMELAQALGQRPAESYAILFKDINAEEVTLALARAHAASGDAKEALAWASQIGSSRKIGSKDDDDTRWAVQHRIHALIGVAEGILDRSSGAVAGTAPRR